MKTASKILVSLLVASFLLYSFSGLTLYGRQAVKSSAVATGIIPVTSLERPLTKDTNESDDDVAPDSRDLKLKSLSRDLCKMWKLHYEITPGKDLPDTVPTEVQQQWESLQCNSFFRIRREVFGGRAAVTEMFSRDVDAHEVRQNNGTWIALLTPMMSSPGKAKDDSLTGADSLVFWRYLWKTFLDTSAHNLAVDSTSYWYTFYFGIDQGDEGLEDYQIIAQVWERMQRDLVVRGLDPSKVGLRAFVANDTAQAPSWMVSHLALEAFCTDVDYFYQINDDVSMRTRDWEDHFISTLRANDNLGATGPQDLYNKVIFTQSFVHRTHMSIFAPYYFPLRFRNHSSDTWLTRVYQPLDSAFRQNNVTVLHEYKAVGQRYVSATNRKYLDTELKAGEQRIRSWLQTPASHKQMRGEDREAKCS